MRLALRDHARVAAVLGLALGAIALGGCSKKNVREPAELKDIVNPAIKLQTVWTASAGNGGGKYYSELTLSLAPDALFAADVDGRIFAFDPSKGSRIWTDDTGTRRISGPTVDRKSTRLNSSH